MYNIKTYENGLRLVHNFDDSTNAVSIVFHCLAGGVDEDETNRGIAHLLEHMFFKGTKKYTAKEIAFTFDKLGIANNAYTCNDSTVFFADGMSKDSETVFEIFSDCYFNSIYDEKLLELEKNIVCSELEMYLDDYKDLAYAKGAEISCQGTPYQYVLGGTVESVQKLKRQDLIAFRDKFYTTNRLIISVSGNISLAEVEDLIQKYVISKSNLKASPVSFKQDAYEIDLKKRFIFEKRDTEQCYCFVGFKNIHEGNKNMTAYKAMSCVWGNLMSSRLFQSIREEKSLVYVIHSYCDPEARAGMNGIMFYANKNNTAEVLKTIREVILDTMESGFTMEELQTAKNVGKTTYTLRFITPSAKARMGAKYLAYHEEAFDIEKILSQLDALTLEDLNNAFKEFVNLNDVHVAIVGKEDNIDALSILLDK